MRLIDRALKSVGLKRIRQAIWKGAEFSRSVWDWATSVISADDAIKGDFRKLRDRARDLARNNPLTRQYLVLLRANVIGPRGVRLQAQIRKATNELDKTVNRNMERAWLDWCRSPMLSGRGSLNRNACLALQTVAIDGEVLIQKIYGAPNRFGFALQLIDPDLLDETCNLPAGPNQNEIRMGVEIDPATRPVAYHLWNRHPAESGWFPRELRRVPASQIIHLYSPERVAQTRGVTWLAQAITSLRQLDGSMEAELIAERISAAKMGFYESDETTSGAFEDGSKPLTTEASPGTIDILPPGYTFKSWDPTHPSAQFVGFVKTAIRWISGALGVSYNALANDLENVNYSSMRSGLLIERDNWRMVQQWFIEEFYQPIYEAWVDAAVLSSAVAVSPRWLDEYKRDVKWIPRGWPWVDPSKDIASNVTAIANGLANRTDILAETGDDYEETIEKLASETQIAQAAGVAISASPAAPASQPAPQDGEEEEILPAGRPGNGGLNAGSYLV